MRKLAKVRGRHRDSSIGGGQEAYAQMDSDMPQMQTLRDIRENQLGS